MKDKMPFYDKEGRVNNPDIARKAAEIEDDAHKKRLGVFPPSKKAVKKSERDAEVFLEHENIKSDVSEIKNQLDKKESRESESRKHREFIFIKSLEAALKRLPAIPDLSNHDGTHSLTYLLEQIKDAQKNVERSRGLSEELAADIPDSAYREKLDGFAEAANELIRIISALVHHIDHTAPHKEIQDLSKMVQAEIVNFKNAAEVLSGALDRNSRKEEK